MNLPRRALPGLFAFGLPVIARAEAFPARPVRLVTPVPSGVGAEATIRLFADGLSRRWGQPVTVENRPGGDGVIAAMAFLGLQDNHKLLLSFAGLFTVNPATIPNLPYRTEQFASVSTVAIDHIAVVASPALQAANLADAVRLARAGAGTLTWASSPGGIAIAFAAFAAEQGISLTRVQYRAVPDMLNDLGEGRIQLAVMPLATALPQARGGRLKLLAVTNSTRSAAAPDLATAAEQGFPKYEFEGFVGVFADARQPATVRRALEEATRAIVSDDAFASRVRTAGQTPFAGGAADLHARIIAQGGLVEAGLRHLPPGG
ncbi:Bug family tripartite tricarboxylate transporter substrate binding protein [Falsiroseomonas tokyonensis]|uniref:Bug family tripartite tricarboxylate transporter substrate binding protein n=1 Tax=Falsiroseomonas tokyonensis TaxID=430521 RepID=A0ABV7C1X6_9PROT|nr:tripartite tricarboxylate transporter substrate binding protein [Falsiroseomonas tokyonensis]MBU8540647.1 tripartite tricarboxylate transporter substrate binding protein [Falsiroseomonas tokyonensis]